ncbi:hypothetical protein DQ04_03601010 [Trypanosoma grayi]|uniref:hypothetical protein n=1 Tax=Trypanosoma grayi TaxID=71804 RepID=UPI0004F49F30|nr:hypothetical protein DQ04_03601010 [Trypanosoma grayi]KEG10536.1 hypothetical protein DQ04_03601010 [Trypanosoma grayi]
MGTTCSKTTNQAELESRRIQREIRLGLAPLSRLPSNRHSLVDGRASVSTHQGPRGAYRRVTTSSVEYGAGMRHISPHRNGTGIMSSPRRALTPNVVERRSLRLSRHLPPSRFPPPPREGLASKDIHKPVSNAGKMKHPTPKGPNGRDSTPKSKTAESHGSKTRVEKKNLEKIKLKPVVRQALNLLSVEELQCRAEIMNEANAHFSELEVRFGYFVELETIRVAAFELFVLQTKSREAVYEQEGSERKLLLFWMNQTLEEAKLKDLIEATQRRHRSMSPRSSNYRRSKSLGSQETSSKRPSNSRKRSSSYYLGGDRRKDESEMLMKQTTPVSTPRVDRIAPVVERDILSEDLNRKIGRQTLLMRGTLPSYSPNSANISPHVISNVAFPQQVCNKAEFHPQKHRPAPPVPSLPSDWREESSSRPVFYDPYRTPLRSTSAHLKGESDLAMKKRLAALLMA